MQWNSEIAKRILRTAVMTFIGVYGASNIINVVSGTSTFDASLARAAGAAAAVSIVTALWNIFLDPSAVPSLRLKADSE